MRKMKKLNTFKQWLFVVIGFTLSQSAMAQLKVGNNPTTLNSSASLEVESSNKGFLPPRVALTGSTDATTILSPAKGLIVYNTAKAGAGTTLIEEGLVVNNGTPDSPTWAKFGELSNTSGVATNKILYVGTTPDPNRIVTSGRFQFRLNSNWVPEFRLTSDPLMGVNISYFTNQLWSVNGYEFNLLTKTYTQTDWSVWKHCSTSSSNGVSTSEMNVVYMVYPGESFIYEIKYIALGGGAGTTIAIVANRY